MFNSILNWFFGKSVSKKNSDELPATVLPPKDPLDGTLTPSSTKWKKEHYCMSCKLTTNDKEVTSGICGSCGHMDNLMILRERAVRKIWNGEKWVGQRKYSNNPEQYQIFDL
jgi:hypothetical protein